MSCAAALSPESVVIAASGVAIPFFYPIPHVPLIQRGFFYVQPGIRESMN